MPLAGLIWINAANRSAGIIFQIFWVGNNFKHSCVRVPSTSASARIRALLAVRGLILRTIRGGPNERQNE